MAVAAVGLWPSLQALADADWWSEGLDEAQAQVRANPGLRLVGPIRFEELGRSVVRVEVEWDDTGSPWSPVALVSGIADVKNCVSVRTGAATATGCIVDIDIYRPVTAGAFRLFVLAASPEAISMAAI